MRCNEARKTLYKSEYPEPVSNQLLKAKRHVKDCKDCIAFLEAERAFGTILRKAIEKDVAPEDLRNRLLNMKKPERRSSKRTYQFFAIAATILIFVIAGYIFRGGSDNTPIIGQIVNDHIQFLPSPEIQISSTSRDEIREWFKGKVVFAVNIPSLSAELKGGRLCLFNKKRVVLLFYEHNGSPISVFIIDGLDLHKIDAGKEVMLKGRKTILVEDKGFNLLLWQERGLTYALVSDLSLEEIKKLI